MIKLPSCNHDYTDIHAYACGEFLEVSMTLAPIAKGVGGTRDTGNHEPETPESIRARATARARRTIRRLVNTNNLWVMHTLTYAIKHPQYFQGERPFSLRTIKEQKNREIVQADWKSFRLKMQEYLKKKGVEFRYIAVIEKHTGKKTKDTSVKVGTYHIHFCSDRVFDKRLLQAKWRHGFCNYSDWRKGRKKNDLDTEDTLGPVDNPGAYMSKYLGKDADTSEVNRKRYWRSKNLAEPVPLHSTEMLAVVNQSELLWEQTTEIQLPEGGKLRKVSQTRKLTTELASELNNKPPPTAGEKRKRRLKTHYEVLQQQAERPIDKEMECYDKSIRGNNKSQVSQRIKRKQAAVKCTAEGH